MGWLDGTSALVTGGASGLGRSIVERFVAEGARVVVLDRSAERLDQLGADLGDAVRTTRGDVTSYEDNARACALAEREFGGLDTFVANAGLWDFGRSLTGTPVEELSRGFDELFAINVKGYLLGARAAAPLLRTSRGSMIFTLSSAALFPGPGGGPIYTAAKHAALGLLRQFAYELAPDVRVNGVAPGVLETGISGPESMGLADSHLDRVLPLEEIVSKGTALGVVVRPEDVVGPYVLLASKDSTTTTGTVIDVSSVGVPPRP
ncbi:SDR family NAD(P)-dependent oxidoreductase [Streptomyces sp. ML-6]|uniref:SDR family NAD(P)-dependent oxidoreductase n=1 Tax=unclassified Streptomyces TaxID=2593676 RepID=UPI0024C0D2CB|nr:SDR family NAD(P)-dependent oxidoreductase [Streptomyces sp. ML-6]MDK0524233.1 SDR family oxidoreductase [Streptomyces sp. ML-6]